MTRTPSNDVMRGTLDMLILKTLADAPLHGWGIAQQIQQVSREALQIGQGSLYPALQRLEEKGWVDSEWTTTPDNRRARYYRLTSTGRRAARQEEANWRRYVAAVDLVLGTSSGG